MNRKMMGKYRMSILFVTVLLLVAITFGGFLYVKEINTAKGPLVIKKYDKSELDNVKGDIKIYSPITNRKNVNKVIQDYYNNELSPKLIQDYPDHNINIKVDIESNYNESIVSIVSYRIDDSEQQNIIDLYQSVVINLNKNQKLLIHDLFEEQDLKNLSMLVREALGTKKEIKYNRDMYLKTIPKYESFEDFIVEGDQIVFLYPKDYFGNSEYVMAPLANNKFIDYIKSDQLNMFVSNYTQKEKVNLRYIDPLQPMVALTFDDGPFPPTTEKLAQSFADKQSRVTFFTLGSRVNENSDFVKKVSDLGHEIANHSFDHPNLVGLKPDEIKKQTVDTANTIKKITGQQDVLLRPPFGSYDDKVLEHVEAPVIMWNIDTMDWKTRDKNANIRELNASLQDGNIILMHDIYDASVDAASEFIEGYQGDVQFVTVSELLAYKGMGSNKGKVYFSAG